MAQLDTLVVRGVVLGILRAYMEPSNKHEKEIEGLLPLLQYAQRADVREQAARTTRLWLGLKHRDPIRHRRLIYYRLRHLDEELEKLNQMTRPTRKKK